VEFRHLSGPGWRGPTFCTLGRSSGSFGGSDGVGVRRIIEPLNQESSENAGVAKRRFFAVCLGLGLLLPSAARAEDVVQGEEASTEILTGLASDVEQMVARTKPIHWEARRSCLYYAFAGQRLLARQGIAASLWVGTIVYDPGTPAAYPITPHAWLETADEFIDYSTLPRWGKVTVIPHQWVASKQSDVDPGVTRVLVLRFPEDLDILGYLTVHRARFEHMAQPRAEAK